MFVIFFVLILLVINLREMKVEEVVIVVLVRIVKVFGWGLVLGFKKDFRIWIIKVRFRDFVIYVCIKFCMVLFVF